MKPITNIMAAAALVSLSSFALASGGSPAASTPGSVLPTENGFSKGRGITPIVDDQGRQLILQGLNSGGGKHSFMRRSWEAEQDVAHQAKNMGYNSHRYLIFWDHVMPQRGVIDTAYLDDIEARLQWFADNDMQVVLDMHQDNWGQACGGNGAPDWASSNVESEAAPGAPWWLVAASPCVIDSKKTFYSNSTGLQDQFAQAWKAVAQRFANHPAVIGYDLLNEPTETNAIVDYMIFDLLEKSDKDLLNFAVLGTIWIDGHPYNAFSGLIKDKIRDLAASQNLTAPESYIQAIGHALISRNKGDWGSLNALREFESETLTSLYQKVINSIRQVDQNSYIFVEPMSVSVNDGDPTYLKYLSDPRQGNRRLGYIPHLYPRALHEGKAYSESDWNTVNEWEGNHIQYAYNNNMAMMIGEFGNSGDTAGSVDFIRNTVRMTERNHIGWLYWDSQPESSWSPIAPDKVSDRPNAAALINVYPRAVAGKLESYHFDRVNKTFSLSYRNTSATGTTDIAVPPRFYPSGLVVTSTDADNTWSYVHDTEHNIVRITHNPNALTHSITVKPSESTQALVYADLRNNKSGNCLDFEGTFASNGKKSISYACSNKMWQQWAYDSANQFIRNNQNPEYCLSHGDASQAKEDGIVEMKACSDSDDHRWILDGNYIRNIYNSNIVLDAYGTENASRVGQWSFHGGSNQQWFWAWKQDSGSMENIISSLKKGSHYEMKIQSQENKCGLEWEGGNANASNERNAKFDCSNNGDLVTLKISSEPVIHANGSISLNGLMYTRGTSCGFEWAGGSANSNNEREAKWDCEGNADPIRITTSSNGAAVVFDANNCGLEWAGGNADSNNERNAKWDCSPHFDEMLIRSIHPAGYLGDLDKPWSSDLSAVGIIWHNHDYYTYSTVTGDESVRYIRISLPGASALSLAEVKVLDANGNNIALGKTATQSSTVYDGSANRAIDGNTNGVWAQGSTTHTDNEANTWWMLDLGSPMKINNIEIHNRTDCCTDRLNGATVEIFN